MTSIDSGRVESLARKSMVLKEAWLREHQAAMAERLAANVEVRKRWLESDPIKVSQSQHKHQAVGDVRLSSPTSLRETPA